MNIGKQIKEGLLTRNPVLVQLLGLCAALAVTTSVMNGLVLGLSVAVILPLSGVCAALLRNILPQPVRAAAKLVITAGLAAVADLLLQALLPEVSESLGIFVPLIAVNGILFSQADDKPPLATAVDGLSQGAGYTLVLLAMGAVRELLGSGAVLGYQIFPARFAAVMMTLPVGGFLTLGCLMALVQWVWNKRKGGE